MKTYVTRVIGQHRAKQPGLVLTSQLSRLECRVRPLAIQDEPCLAAYDAFFASNGLVLLEISPRVIDRATDLRARYGFKSPDALHVAAAIEGEADVFITGDQLLARCTELTVEVLRPPPA